MGFMEMMSSIYVTSRHGALQIQQDHIMFKPVRQALIYLRFIIRIQYNCASLSAQLLICHFLRFFLVLFVIYKVHAVCLYSKSLS